MDYQQQQLQRAAQAAAVARYQQQRYYYQQQQQQQQQQYQQQRLQHQNSLPQQPHVPQYIDARLSQPNDTTTNNNNNNNNNPSKSNINTPNQNIPPIDTATNNSTNSNTNSNNNTNNNGSNSFVGGILMNNGILNETDPKLACHMDLNDLVKNSGRTTAVALSRSATDINVNNKSDRESNNNKLTTPTDPKDTHSNTSNNNTPTSITVTELPLDPNERSLSNSMIINSNNATNNSSMDPTSSQTNNHNSISSNTSSNASTNNPNNNNNNNNNNTNSNTNTNTNTINDSTTSNNNNNATNPQHQQGFKMDVSFRDISQQNKNIYNYAMNNNPHAINDPAIQESLSPYFQPFGVDVSHLPMTNPPIFQNSVPLFDEPVRRRRISISNGQISQLGEDIETVENLYNTQPPPMPVRYNNNNNTHNNTRNTTNNDIHKQQQQHQHQAGLLQPLPIVPGNENEPPPPPSLPPQQQQWQNGNLYHNGALPQQQQQQPPQQPYRLPMGQQPIPPQEPNGDLNQLHNPAIMIQSQIPLGLNQPPLAPQQLQQQLPQQQPTGSIDGNGVILTDHMNDGINGSNTYIKRESISSTVSSRNSLDNKEANTPGTEAWKRARLLERNRVAASKCRQRKKIAQLQLQKDFDNLSKENMIIKKKLNYYEKLITKFKKFTQSHFEKCHSSDDFKDLNMIEEMLMIDQDVYEVNENGTVLKMAENSYV